MSHEEHKKGFSMETTQDSSGTGSTWLGNLTQIGGVVAPIVTAIKGTNKPTTTPPANPVMTAASSPKLWLIVGGVIVLILGAFLFLRRK